MSDFPALGHVAVTVKDLSVSRPWYGELIGADPVLDEDTDAGYHHTVFDLSGTLLGLHERPGTDTADTSTEPRTGLVYLAFACPDRAALEGWRARLDELGIGHGDILDARGGPGLSFRDPDGIVLEFLAPPA